jgi:ADP-heptose:LPS heptosyltransferase
LITALSRAKQTVGFKKNPLSFTFSSAMEHDIRKGLHEIERNHQLIKSWTQPEPELPKLYPSKQDFDTIQPFLKSEFICIAPTSVWFTKQFPMHKWVEFIRTLPAGMVVYLLGAPSDREACDQITQQCDSVRLINLAGRLTLMESAALMLHSKLCLVNDSAPMHLASSVNAPTVAVFCSTIPSFGFGPLSQSSMVMETPEELKCRPCGLHGKKHCPEGHFKCAETIHLTWDKIKHIARY